MPQIARCVRCGRITATGFTGFNSWHLSEDGAVICPHCLTPSETDILPDSAEDRLLRDLDPDNDDPPR